jgi:membrane-bound serine protease (ClpP class)
MLKSTGNIVGDIFASIVPVVIYAYSSWAQAAPALVFIALAFHIAVMALGTNIGAFHPVMMSDGGTYDFKDNLNNLMKKTANDADAFIRSIAEKRYRNIGWSEKTVLSSASLSETEAFLDIGS